MRAAASGVDRERTLQLLVDLVKIPSPTGQEERIANYIIDWMKGAGFDEVQADEHWNVLGTVRGGNDGPTLLFLTHTDSGPAGRMVDPFSANVMDGASFGVPDQVVYGRGAAAPKGAIAAYLEGARALIEHGREHWRGAVQVACVTKDLAANHGGVRELDQSIGLAADYVIAGEPSDNQVVMGARGISHIEVTLRGKPTHWGKPAEGVNPLYGLADLLRRVEAMDLPVHDVLGSATVSAFDVGAEYEAPRTPHTARARFDRRVLPGETIDEVLAPFRDLVSAIGAECAGLSGEVEQVRGMYSFQAPADSPLKAALLAAGRAVAGRDLGTTFIPFGSNAGYTIQELGIPGVAFAPGRITDVGDWEHVEIDTVVEAARIVAATCVRLLGSGA